MFRKLLFLGLIFAACLRPLAGQKAVSSFHNFGKIAIDAPMEHTFEFQNDRSEPLEIKNVQMQPPLVVAKMTSRVEPGKVGTVTIRLDKPRPKGPFKGTVVVNFKNDSIQPLVFWTAGELVPPIEFDPMPAFFVSAQRGETKTASLDIINHQPGPFEIIDVIHSSSRFTTKLEKVKQGRRYRLSLSLKGEGPAGRQTDTITLATSSRERPFLEVQANTNINERVYTFPPVLDLDTINVMALKARPELARSFSAELTIYQKAGTNFQVLSAQTDVPFLQLTPFQAQLKDRFGIRVRIIPEKLKAGEVKGSIAIATNDPEFPRLTVPVNAVVEGDW